jgi:hypothetical protein
VFDYSFSEIFFFITLITYILLLIYSIFITYGLFNKRSKEVNINDDVYVKIINKGVYKGKVVNKRFTLDGYIYTCIYDDSHQVFGKMSINEFYRSQILIDKLNTNLLKQGSE